MSESWVLLRTDGSFLMVNGYAIRVFSSKEEAEKRRDAANRSTTKNQYMVIPAHVPWIAANAVLGGRSGK